MDFIDLYRAIQDWAHDAQRSGWLECNDLKGLEEIEQQQAAALFEDQRHRPLIVGLFGGTGVGKSSLLNRLAGEPIARAGIERPTSHEVTFYLHKDFRLGLLPPELPMEQTRLAYHNKPERRLLAWLDMPDMDSTETRNRDLVEEWLPYLDWIVYVVSPERYHDDIGWRFLQQRARRHAWLFVMNQWDRGRPEQLEDFRRRLTSEGFAAPHVLRTSCSDTGVRDDFDRLEGVLNQAIQDHGLALLQQLGLQSRLVELEKLAGLLAARLGNPSAWKAAQDHWNDAFSPRLAQFRKQLDERAIRLTASFRGRMVGDESLPGLLPGLAEAFWTERESAMVEQWNDLLLDGLRSRSLPAKPLQRLTRANGPTAGNSFRKTLEGSLNDSLAHPGHWLQRGLYHLAGLLEWLLPLTVTAWAGRHLATVYWLALDGRASFLGMDFAVHSILLIALAWMVPWLLHRRLKPSPVVVIKRGLREGVRRGCGQMAGIYEAPWAQVAEERDGLLDRLVRIVQRIPRSADGGRISVTTFTT